MNAVNKQGISALIAAAGVNPSAEIAESLIDLGADVNARDKEGMTALMLIARKRWGICRFAECLIKNGADMERKDNKGRTALVHAWNLETPNGMDFARWLIKMGARDEGRHGPFW